MEFPRTMRGRALLAGMAVAAASPARADTVWTIELGAKPGSLRVTNGTGETLRLERRVLVQRVYEGQWITIDGTVMTLNGACPAFGAAATLSGCITLRPGGTIEPQPWQNTCDGQCQRGCRASPDNGNGPFRFIVRACGGGGGTRTSETFRLPQ